MPTQEDVAKALKELQDAGAEIQEAPKPQQGQKIASAAIDSLRRGIQPQFGAWVSWTKSF